MSGQGAAPARRPAIVSPVAQLVDVADVPRSVAFYRDVLGFDERGITEDYGRPADAEVAYGPARIQFGAAAAPSPSVLFFEVDDVDAMHEAVRRRGGRPSDVAQVNWIKQSMFEIRDPDGHVLWFGRSFAGPEGDRASERQPQVRKIMPELPLDDVAAGVTHYRDVLGFRVNYAQDNLGVMDRDKARVLLIARTPAHQGIGSACLYVENADAVYEELRSKGANVQGEPISRPWGLREFAVLDPEGNRLTFAQTFE
jgi:catechol 2,3-dioxygenase-like lactoylglutathione lyase family enzyme